MFLVHAKVLQKIFQNHVLWCTLIMETWTPIRNPPSLFGSGFGPVQANKFRDPPPRIEMATGCHSMCCSIFQKGFQASTLGDFPAWKLVPTWWYNKQHIWYELLYIIYTSIYTIYTWYKSIYMPNMKHITFSKHIPNQRNTPPYICDNMRNTFQSSPFLGYTRINHIFW